MNIDNVRLYSVGLEIETCDRNDAGTDNSVTIGFYAAGSPFYALRRPDDERRRNTVDYYDVIMATSGAYGSSLQGLIIHKEGTDRWDICRVALYVNQLRTPVWEVRGLFSINANGGHQNRKTWQPAELRSSTRWTQASSTVTAPPSFISVDDLEILFETVQGHVNYTNNRVAWGRQDGSEWVSASPSGTTQLHVDADLEWTPSGVISPEADYDETIQLSCNSQGQAVATLASWDMACHGEPFVNGGQLCKYDMGGDHGWYERALDRVFAGVNALGGASTCSDIHLDVNGSIYF